MACSSAISTGSELPSVSIRRRVSKRGLTSICITMRDILDERARELAFEEHRWPTLLRLDKTGGQNPDMKYQLENYTMFTNDLAQDGIVPQWTLFPIPLTVINLNKEAQLEQNPGWN